MIKQCSRCCQVSIQVC